MSKGAREHVPEPGRRMEGWYPASKVAGSAGGSADRVEGVEGVETSVRKDLRWNGTRRSERESLKDGGEACYGSEEVTLTERQEAELEVISDKGGVD